MLGNTEPIIDKQLEFMHEKEKSRLGIAHPTMSTCKQKMFFFTNLPSEPRNITRMHSSRIRATRSLPYGQKTPGQRPLDTDPMYRDPWTQTLCTETPWT